MKSLSSYLSIISQVLIAVGLFLFPITVLPILTDPFTFAKQAILLAVTFIGLILWGLKMIVDKKVTINVSPLLTPLFAFFTIVLVSALIPLFQTGGNLKTPLISAYPILTFIPLYFLIIQTVEKDKEHTIIMSLLIGTALAGILSLLSFLQIYVIPFEQIKFQSFNTFGNLLQALIFFVALIPVAITTTLAHAQHHAGKRIGHGFIALILVASSLVIAYQLVTTQKPLLLPQTTGLQTATGPIGQNFQSLLFGTGPGTYLSNFTRFRGVDFNQESFWDTRFLSSSSLALELLSTIGLLGLASFLFLAYKFLLSANTTARGNGLFLGTLALFLASLILPFGISTLALLFILLALYTMAGKHVSDITLHIIALGKTASANILPSLLFVLILAVSVFSLYYSTIFLLSDLAFQQSLVAASQNRGTETYNKQRDAINMFPYRDGYLRTFSQTNLALANALAQKGQDLTDQERQTIVNLIQQSITSARGAAGIFPTNVFNWENLAGIYRSLIGFGQNADQFAIASAQTAARLDPANPQMYIFLGGIHFQLQQWDQAITQFQTAVTLKPDFANARYNLGHALESKGDLRQAVAQYQVVANILANVDQTQPGIEDNKKKIADEIDVLTRRIGEQEATSAAQIEPGQGQQPPLSIDRPSTQLPPQRPPVQIPAPQATESAR